VKEEHMTETLQDVIDAARLSGVPEAVIEEKLKAFAPERAYAQAVRNERDKEAVVRGLRSQAEALATAAVDQQQDVEAAERRAAPLLAEAERLVTVYRAALAQTARDRAALAVKLEVAEAELAAARAAEQEAFAEMTRRSNA
jgi:hypothetical protein